MPRYAPDHELLQSTRQFVAESHDQVVRRAAGALNVDYVMLRRFLVSGRAAPENRQKLRSALEGLGWKITMERNISHNISVEVTRSMLTQLLNALDALHPPASLAEQRDAKA
jgi:hypothetical protein